MGLLNIFRRKEKAVNALLEKAPVNNLNEHFQASDTGDETARPLSFKEERMKYIYEHPERLVDIEFSNRTKRTVNIWVEISCMSIDLDHETEYKIVTHDRSFRMEFDENNQVVFYLQYSFGFKLYKRPASKDGLSQTDWQLEFDLSDIN